MRKIIVRLSLPILFIVLPWPTMAQDVRFEARVDKTRMVLDDTLMLSFVLSGGNVDLNVLPELPDLKESFDVLRGPSRSTSISIVNGRQSSSLTLQYLLSPKKTGTLTIGPATLRSDKHTYTTEPILIEVVQSAQPATPNAPGSPDASGTPQNDEMAELFIRAETDKTTAYIGEQITLSHWLYTQVSISGYDFTQPPALTGFWVEEFQLPQPRLQEQVVNGVTYGVALMKKAALFPTKSGQMTIDPLTMTLNVKVRAQTNNPFDQFFNDPFGDVFSRTQEIVRKTQPIDLTILPLPDEGKPAIFSGDVGNFTMAVQLDQTQVKQGDPLTLTIKIQGVGNIKTVKEPQVTLPESFKRYDPEIKEQMFPGQEPLQGEKIFTSVIIPSAAGKYDIEPVAFAYFDPQRKAYQTIRSAPLTVTILPAAQTEPPLERRITTKEEIKLLGQDIRFIKTDIPHIENQGQMVYQTNLFRVLLIAPLFLVGLGYGVQRYRRKYHQDERLVRQRQARKHAARHFKTAAAFLKQGDSKGFYASISQILRHYLGAKLNMPPAGIQVAEICQELTRHGLDLTSVSMLQRCLETCDFARFAPGTSSAGEMETMLQQAEQVIAQIDRLKFDQPAATMPKIVAMLFLLGSLLMFCLPAFPGYAALSADDLFQEGNRLYEAGNYAEALEQYQQILRSGIQNGAVYYNIGNALLKQQRIGEAILAYERAKRLLPRDADVTFNLEYARALALDKLEPWNANVIMRFLVSVRDWLTPNEVSLAVLVTYLLLVIVILLFIISPRRQRSLILFVGILPATVFLFAGTILISQVFARHAVTEAIVLTSDVTARTGPGESYSTVFEMHAGAKVRIQREKLDWVEIQLPNKVIGWVRQNEIERI